MAYSTQDKERIRHQFDRFCTTTLKYAARTIYREQKRRSQSEVSLSELQEIPISQLSYTDNYHTSPHSFSVLDFNIAIRDELLFEALTMLVEERRRVILLAYYLGMNDREIDEMLNLARATVQ